MYKIFKDVLPEHIRLAALATFPDESWEHWHHYESGKLATKDRDRIPPACLDALSYIALVCRPDEGFYDPDLVGAGLHYMPAGSALGEHTDATFASNRPWRRTGSLVYFPEKFDGGQLVVAGDVIRPEVNTAVLFSGGQLHEVLTTYTPRRTFALFSYVVDHSKKSTTRANFTRSTQL